jgi:hypothetical protein
VGRAREELVRFRGEIGAAEFRHQRETDQLAPRLGRGLHRGELLAGAVRGDELPQERSAFVIALFEPVGVDQLRVVVGQVCEHVRQHVGFAGKCRGGLRKRRFGLRGHSGILDAGLKCTRSEDSP